MGGIPAGAAVPSLGAHKKTDAEEQAFLRIGLLF